ncbi:MAG: glutathione S-transferase N-terminal domain-containing protein [Alphaproteobacteria bacterium]|nr:glutathione S-transferase N-terminal domain-containing protein [Alphaproteobacteria bacterium]
MPLLLHLPYSPWSERARWALDLRGVPYRSEHYQPVLGEARLRRLRTEATGPLTVPVLIMRERVLTDSREIARFAEAEGGVGPTLFPEGRDLEIHRLDALADTALAAGRGLALRRTLQDPDALAEMLPGSLRWTGPAGRAVSAWGIRRVLRKYDVDQPSDEALRQRATAALDELRAALAEAPDPAEGQVRTFLGQLSYADLTAAQALAFVRPPATGLRMGPANRRAFTDPVLAERHADLLAWRDALYAAFR